MRLLFLFVATKHLILSTGQHALLLWCSFIAKPLTENYLSWGFLVFFLTIWYCFFSRRDLQCGFILAESPNEFVIKMIIGLRIFNFSLLFLIADFWNYLEGFFILSANSFCGLFSTADEAGIIKLILLRSSGYSQAWMCLLLFTFIFNG